MWIQKLRCGVQHLAYSLDGRFLYTLDTSGAITVWDVTSHSGLRIPPENRFRHWSVRGIHPITDGRLLIRAQQFSVLDKSGELTIQPGPPGLGAAFAQIRSDGRTHYVESARRTILGCDLGSNLPKAVFTMPESAGHWPDIDKFDWSRKGRCWVTRAADGSLGFFELRADGKSHDFISVPGVPPAYRVQLSPDGKTMFVFSNAPDSRFTLWDVASRSVRVSNVECSMTWGVFAFNPVYPLFAMCQKDGTLAIWSLEDGRPVRSVDFALGRAVQCVAFSPDGLTCAVGGTNKQFAVFDVDV